VLYLGFLKFLKRDKKKDIQLDNIDNLDMPPAPPGMDMPPPNLGEKDLEKMPELPELPEINGDETFPPIKEKPLPDLELPSEKPLPELKIPEENTVPELDLPPLPGPKIEEDVGMQNDMLKIPQPSRPLFGVPKPVFGAPEQKPSAEMTGIPKPKPEIRSYERLERAAIREENAVLSHEKAEGPIYVRVDRFKEILTGTQTIRNDLKTASQSIVKLNEIDINRDKVFEKWHNVMMDLQKKLIFIDKTLFKK